MHWQVMSLTALNIEAASLNSTTTSDEYRLAMSKLRSGMMKLLYITPEKFSQSGSLMNMVHAPQSFIHACAHFLK
jgi:superfamily II DNA helicase RecQ